MTTYRDSIRKSSLKKEPVGEELPWELAEPIILRAVEAKPYCDDVKQVQDALLEFIGNNSVLVDGDVKNDKAFDPDYMLMVGVVDGKRKEFYVRKDTDDGYLDSDFGDR